MGAYIVFDGMDGAGKGTQIELLKKKLSEPVVFTREPGGTPFAEEIRKVVRDNPLAGASTALNNFLLFWAAREELQQNLVAPALQEGKHVFSDRGDSSTYAFQMYGEEHRELQGLFKIMREQVFEARSMRRPPDLYVVLDLPAKVARERAMQDASRQTTHFDGRDLAYYERVREGFQSFSRYYPVEFIDASRPPHQVHRDVMNVLAVKRNLVPKLAYYLLD